MVHTHGRHPKSALARIARDIWISDGCDLDRTRGRGRDRGGGRGVLGFRCVGVRTCGISNARIPTTDDRGCESTACDDEDDEDEDEDEDDAR